MTEAEAKQKDCPFWAIASYAGPGPEGTSIKCTGRQCLIWNRTHKTCGLAAIGIALSNIEHWLMMAAHGKH